MRRIRRWIAIAVVVNALAVGGCATMTVGSHIQSGTDFSQYRPYDWGPADALPICDPRLDKNRFFRDHVMDAVEKLMAARGYVQSRGRAPDLLIHYHASINQRIDVCGGDYEHGYCYDDDCKAMVREYEAGTLVLDVVDARSNRVVWRGWAQDTVEDVLENRDRMARKIDEAVGRMLARLPPSL